MKKITNKTILKQGDKTYQPVEVEGVVYWIDVNPQGFSKGEWMYNEPNNDILIYQFDHDVYPYEIGNKIVAQSQFKLEGVPVISLDSYVEKLAKKEFEKILNNSESKLSKIALWKDGYNSNSNQYTQKDIEKVIELARYSYMSEDKILEQINSISVIEVDEQFNILRYD